MQTFAIIKNKVTSQEIIAENMNDAYLLEATTFSFLLLYKVHSMEFYFNKESLKVENISFMVIITDGKSEYGAHA